MQRSQTNASNISFLISFTFPSPMQRGQTNASEISFLTSFTFSLSFSPRVEIGKKWSQIGSELGLVSSVSLVVVVAEDVADKVLSACLVSSVPSFTEGVAESKDV